MKPEKPSQKIEQDKFFKMRAIKVRFAIIAFLSLMAIVMAPILGLSSILPPVLLIICAAFLSNLAWQAWGKKVTHGAYFATFIDVFLITAAIHYIGGMETPLVWIYAIALISIGSLRGVRVSMFAAALSSVMYSFLLLAEFASVIPHRGFGVLNPEYLHQDKLYLYIKLFSDNILFFVAAAASGIFSERLARYKNKLEASGKDLEEKNEQLRLEVAERRRTEEALRENEEKYRGLFENSIDASFTMDLEGNYVSCNPAVGETLGYSPDEIVGTSYKEHVVEESREMVFEKYNQLFQTGVSIQNIQYDIITKSGERRTIEGNVSLVKKDGRIVGFQGTARDISDRKWAEEALEESEKRHRIIAENVKDMIWALDIDTLQFTYISPSVEAMRGYTVEEAMDQGLEDVLTPASLETAIRALMGQLAPENVKKEGPNWSRTIELEQTCKDGSTRWMETTVTFARNPDGKPLELLGVTRDIADRRKAEEALRNSEEALRESEQRLSTTLNAVPDMVYELALDGTFIYANEIASETLGIPLDKLGEVALLDLLDEEGFKAASREIQRILETGETSRNVMYNLKTSDGRIIPVDTHAVVLERKGQAPTILGVARDITEKKLLEQQLLQAQKMESIGTLAGGIAHDFNNILGGILGYASFMKSQVEPDHAFFKYLDTIERSSTRAAELTAQLLGFARGGKYDAKPLDLNEAVRETLEIIGRTIDKSIAIETQMSESLPTVEADGGQLQQVLMNLIINAAEAMPAGGVLTIETDTETLSEEYAHLHMGAKAGLHVRLSVTDTGIGMDKETQGRIFEPFFTRKKEGKGTGLGLSMVYGVVKNHGGYITVYSEPGHGTTFKIYMPVSGEAESTRTPAAPAPHGRGELILVVDDEEPIRDFAKDVLEGNGYHVILAENGVQAVRICEEHNGGISLIILDMVMPNMGGREAFLKIKAGNPGARALLSTGYSQNGKAQEILDSGVKGFLQKPYQPDALLSKVRSVIDAED